MQLQDPYNIFKEYVSLKLHFTTEHYNYRYYKGHINVSYQAFQERKDRLLFYNLSTLLNEGDTVHFLISQFIGLPNFTIGKVLKNPQKSEKIYDEWKGRNKDIYGTLKKDLMIIAERSLYDWKSCFRKMEGDYSLIFKLVSAWEISPESYCLLDSLFGYLSKIYTDLEGDTMFKALNFKYKKYKALMNFSMARVLELTPKNLKELDYGNKSDDCIPR